MLMDISEIRKILPQQEPFIMIDGVVAFEPGVSLTAVKNITGNEWIYAGENKISGRYPETLVMEAASQTALVFKHLTESKRTKPRKIFLGRIKYASETSVCIGDQLFIQVMDHKMLSDRGLIGTVVKRRDELIASVEIMYSSRNQS